MFQFLLTVITAMAVFVFSPSATAVEKDIQATFEPATFARFVAERKDDFAWENDLVAFRAYGPALRQGAENAGVDCWLKRVEQPIINLWYSRHQQGISYHKDHGEGLDNYHVGSSAGCGSTSLWLNSKRVPLETYTQWKIIEQSQQKTVFVLTYEKRIAGDTYKEEKQISIELGQRLYSVTSTFWKNGDIAKVLPVTVALATHDEKAMVSVNLKNGWLSAWEILDEYGLGTAVRVDPKQIKATKIIHSNGIKDNGHALFVLHTNDQGQIAYQAGYGWQKAGVITSSDKWHQYLNNLK
ncbi:DUF4861 family protein [Thalassotalea sp. PLHSN55]|uniref:DUF4861 family protein n=1 Tax=Thalassotalea sp. PLHSN55 TaxID=3435888 RepID=UPI003F84957E